MFRCVELGRIKCAQYWPQIGAVRKYGDITVENLISDDKRSYVLRVFSLKKDVSFCQSCIWLYLSPFC